MGKAVEREVEQVETPAKITPLHVNERPALDNNMRPITGKTAWTKWTPLEAQYRHGKLVGGSTKFTAVDRFNAGKQYEEIWDTAQSAGRDSTQALNISRGSGGLALSQAQAKAVKSLVTVENRLGQRDRIIIRMVCGMGHFPSEAVRTVCEDYKDSVTARFREALDALIEAFDASRKEPGIVRVG